MAGDRERRFGGEADPGFGEGLGGSFCGARSSGSKDAEMRKQQVCGSPGAPSWAAEKQGPGWEEGTVLQKGEAGDQCGGAGTDRHTA